MMDLKIGDIIMYCVDVSIDVSLIESEIRKQAEEVGISSNEDNNEEDGPEVFIEGIPIGTVKDVTDTDITIEWKSIGILKYKVSQEDNLPIFNFNICKKVEDNDWIDKNGNHYDNYCTFLNIDNL
tara:strand:+ start:214 stop:588 length:375 start_codon:yes stop_codon:yes gene_type:complete